VAGFIPLCSHFTPYTVTQPTAHFSFGQLNVSNIQRDHFPNWALLRQVLLDGLENTRSHYNNQAVSITSGYRTPWVQYQIEKNSSAPSPRSWHVHGDAADLATRSVQDAWDHLHDAALGAGGCVEPQNQSGLPHVHVDWRPLSGCPALWRQ
jgi:uncharacterized protein YcbK (DUF882 family)